MCHGDRCANDFLRPALGSIGNSQTEEGMKIRVCRDEVLVFAR